MTEFTPISALIGGGLIGFAAVLLMWMNGRIAGASGILGGAFRFEKGETLWRLFFVAGLMVAPFVDRIFVKTQITIDMPDNLIIIILAGLLVGVGSQLGNGCVSGHGVCGTARLSLRSIIATITFMIAGMITVYVTRHILGL